MRDLKINKQIVIKFTIEGIHCWDTCNIEEVGYLKLMHRHLFYITITKNVSHNDRDIEIIKFKREVIEYLNKKYYSQEYKCCNFERMSCEDIAEQILFIFNSDSVKVLEDNENGALLFTENL